jgi:flagellar biosynthesis anti-sigma factor FlgM
MRIDPNLSVVPVSSESPKSQTPKAASTGSSQASQASVVALSTAGAAVVADPDAASAAQTMKIEKLRAAVATGTYKVDYETLASRIVDDEVMRS